MVDLVAFMSQPCWVEATVEVKAFDDLDDLGGGWVVQNLVKPDDVILERSLILALETIAPIGWSAGRSPNDYNATAWPQLIIWDVDQMSWDGQLGPSVAISTKQF